MTSHSKTRRPANSKEPGPKEYEMITVTENLQKIKKTDKGKIITLIATDIVSLTEVLEFLQKLRESSPCKT
jgi:hypothetical protein